MYILRSIFLVSFVVVIFNLFTVESAIANVIFNSGEPNNTQWRNSDFSNQFSGEAADDFILSSDNQVTSIGWYGSYLFTATQPMPDDFTINFYSDDADDPEAVPFHTATFTSLVSRTFTGIVVSTADGDFEMYEYEVDISPVALLGNTKYWLSIVNNTQETVSFGGWAWAYNTEANTHRWRSPTNTSGLWNTFGSGNLAFSLHSNAGQVQIDIKPGSDPNPVNPRSNGVIPVAVLGSTDFDAMQVDFSTVTFGPDGATPAHDGHVEDVNDDSIMDMMFHFKTQETGIVCGDTEATLTGETFDETQFTGTDTIKTVGCNGTSSKEVTNSLGAGAMSWMMLLGLSVLGLWGLNRRRNANE